MTGWVCPTSGASEELNPRIIYVSATGYGPDGPHAAKPGEDVLIEARTGWGQLNSVDGRPVPVASAVADTLGAMNGAFGTPARSCTRSAPVRASWCGPACTRLPLRAWRSGDFTFSTPPRVNPNGRGRDMRARTHRRRRGSTPPRSVTSRCQADARSARSRILGIDDLSQDDRFATYWARYDNRAEFTVIVEEALAAKTTTEWLELIEAEVMFAAPVNSMGEAFSDPAVAHTEMVVELDTPVGPMKFFGVPYKLDTTPASVRSPPPLHGQHTNEVLGEAGFSDAEIAELRQAQAI